MRNSLIDLLTEERSLNRQIDDVQEELFNIRNDIAAFMNSPHSDTDAQHRHVKTLDQNVRVNVAKANYLIGELNLVRDDIRNYITRIMENPSEKLLDVYESAYVSADEKGVYHNG